jgi:predicted membrane metal-binding protein
MFHLFHKDIASFSTQFRQKMLHFSQKQQKICKQKNYFPCAWEKLNLQKFYESSTKSRRSLPNSNRSNSERYYLFIFVYLYHLYYLHMHI